MKKTSAFILAILSATVLCAQTIVGTLQMNRNAVLEQYGGMYCVYCPHGHLIAAQLKSLHPDIALIYYHAGNYAVPEPGDPDLRTDEGEIIADAAGLTGYPAASINRHVFPGLEQGSPGTTAISRIHWQGALEEMLALPAPVNIGAVAHIDVPGRELSIDLELYYTTGSAATSNRLHIALIQHHILSPQSGGGLGADYPQYYVFRDMLNGLWGEKILDTSAGHLETRSYSYILPDSIRGVPLDLANTELVVFVTEGQKEVLNSLVVQPDFTVAHAYDARLLGVKTDAVVCGGWVYPTARIRNDGNQGLSSVKVLYGLAGEEGQTHYLNWDTPLATYDMARAELPPLAFPSSDGASHEVWMRLELPNDSTDVDPGNNEAATVFSDAKATVEETIKLEIRTDEYGYELYWQIEDENGTVIAYGGNENIIGTGGGMQIANPEDPGAYGSYSYYTRLVNLPAHGCYYLNLTDDFGDGLCCSYGYGFIRVKDMEGNVLAYAGKFARSYRAPVEYANSITPASNFAETGFEWSVAPNPVRKGEHLTVSFRLPAQAPVAFRIYNAAGQQVWVQPGRSFAAGPHVEHLSPGVLPPGVYLLRLETDKNVFGIKVLLLD